LTIRKFEKNSTDSYCWSFDWRKLSPPKLPAATRLCGSGILIGSSCATGSYGQSLVYDFVVCLDKPFCNHEDNKSNNTEQACSVLILALTSLEAQRTWQCLSHFTNFFQIVLLLPQWTVVCIFSFLFSESLLHL